MCLHANDVSEAEDQVMAKEGIHTEMDFVPGFDFIRLSECLHRCVCVPMMCPRPKTRLMAKEGIHTEMDRVPGFEFINKT